MPAAGIRGAANQNTIKVNPLTNSSLFPSSRNDETQKKLVIQPTP
jgi:hypothetical protein